jgi:hypothetical protein
VGSTAAGDDSPSKKRFRGDYGSHRGPPFDTFTWPGVLLLVLVGLAPCFLAIGLIARWPGMLQLSGLFGVGLMAWIGVQWALLNDRLWLQPAMFIFGAAIAALARRALRRPDL